MKALTIVQIQSAFAIVERVLLDTQAELQRLGDFTNARKFEDARAVLKRVSGNRTMQPGYDPTQSPNNISSPISA